MHRRAIAKYACNHQQKHRKKPHHAQKPAIIIKKNLYIREHRPRIKPQKSNYQLAELQ